MKTAWIRHPITLAVIEVPVSAVPVHAQSGWVPLTEQEVADLQEKRRAERRAAEAATRPAFAATPPPPPEAAPKADEPKSEPTRRKSGSSKENS